MNQCDCSDCVTRGALYDALDMYHYVSPGETGTLFLHRYINAQSTIEINTLDKTGVYIHKDGTSMGVMSWAALTSQIYKVNHVCPKHSVQGIHGDGPGVVCTGYMERKKEPCENCDALQRTIVDLAQKLRDLWSHYDESLIRWANERGKV